MKPANPYQPPNTQSSVVIRDSGPSVIRSLVPASLAVGVMLLVWVVLVSTIDGLRLMRSELLVWATTLILATIISTVTVCVSWKRPLHPFSFWFSFAVFCVTYAILEGGSSTVNAPLKLAFYVATLVLLPVAPFLIVRQWPARNKKTAPTVPSS